MVVAYLGNKEDSVSDSNIFRVSVHTRVDVEDRLDEAHEETND